MAEQNFNNHNVSESGASVTAQKPPEKVVSSFGAEGSFVASGKSTLILYLGLVLMVLSLLLATVFYILKNSL